MEFNPKVLPSSLFKKEFDKFSQPLIKKSSILEKISSIFSSIDTSNEELRHREIKSAVHYGAEHLAQGDLEGNLVLDGLRMAKEALKSLSGENEEILATKIEFAYLIQNSLVEAVKGGFFSRVLGIANTAEIIKETVKKLEVGDCTIIPSGVKGHGMMMVIKRVENKNGEKQFEVIQHNEGEGLSSFHYCQTIAGKRKYQTALEIGNVKGESLYGENSTFFRDLFTMPYKEGASISLVEELYKTILPQLKGKIKEPSSDERCWSHTQLGGSCSARSVLSIIRSFLPKEEYIQFKRELKIGLLYKVLNQIKSGWGNPLTNKLVALEMVRKLKHSYEKDSSNHPPPELEKLYKILKDEETSRIQQERANLGRAIYALISKLSEKDQFHEMALNGILLHCYYDKDDQLLHTAEWEDNLNIAFSFFCKGDIDQAMRYVYQAMKEQAEAGQTENITQERAKKVVKIYQLFAAFQKKNPVLPLEGLNFLAHACSMLQSFLKKNENNIDVENLGTSIQELNKFLGTIHTLYNKAHLSNYFPHGPASKSLEEYQNKFFPETGILTPESLVSLKALLSQD